MAAIIDRLKVPLNGTCLPRQLATDSNGLVLCQVVEVTRQPRPAPCGDELPGRSTVEPEVRDAVLTKMRQLGMCGGEGSPCNRFSLCQLTPAADNVDDRCGINNDRIGLRAVRGAGGVDRREPGSLQLGQGL